MYNEELNFKVSSEKDANGTCKQGMIDTDYSLIVKYLGEPVILNGDKSQAEWVIEFEDGVIATLYDWKESIAKETVTLWTIGGNSKKAVRYLECIIPQYIRID